MQNMADYEAALQPARRAFGENWALKQLLDPRIDPELLELFFVHFSAFGFRMTDPVEGWLRRASARCKEIGMVEFAKALNGHASAEAGHQLMMVEDARALSRHWNESHASKLDPDALLASPPGPGATRYIGLHEAIISGPKPYAQFALQYEIEMLPLRHGPQLIEQCNRLLSPEVSKGLSFLTEHIVVDVGHSKFNARQMERLIAERGDDVPVLIEAGSSVLAAYAEFLCDCMSAAEARRACQAA